MKQLFALLITFTISAFVLAQAPANLVLVNWLGTAKKGIGRVG